MERQKRNLKAFIQTMVVLAGVILAVLAWWHQLYLLFSLILIIGAFIPLFVRFEKRKMKARELVLLAALGAIAAVSRVPFASLPSVQPTTFVIIVTGLVFGGESGFVVGCLAALVSNLFLGQGPWTPWQMMAWGFIGGMAGLLRNKRGMQRLWVKCLFGGAAGYFFGWVMNVWSILSLHGATIKEGLALYSTSFYFDTAHALSTIILLAVFSKSWIKILSRFKKKYGLLDIKKQGY